MFIIWRAAHVRKDAISDIVIPDQLKIWFLSNMDKLSHEVSLNIQKTKLERFKGGEAEGFREEK